jgi:hypothetical protein
MNPDDLARILDDLGRRVGPAGERVFELAVRQQVITNGLWATAAGAVVVIAVAIAVRQHRAMLGLDSAITAIRDAMEAHAEKVREVKDRIREFDAAKEAAQLEAMTEEQRAEWWDARQAFPYLGGYYSTEPSVGDIRRANDDKRFWIGAALCVAALAGVLLLIALPSLLNPEYAAIREIIEAVKP